MVGLWTTMIGEVRLSASVNGLLTPFRSVPTTLQRFCLPLFFHHDDDVYDLGYSGSSLLFRQKGHNFQLSTKHQLRSGKEIRNPGETCILVEREKGHVALSPNGASRVRVGGDDLLPQDILLLEYDSMRGEHDLQPRFLQLDLDETRAFSEVPADSIRLVFSIGYPFAFQEYAPEFDEDYNATSLRVISRVSKLYFNEHSIRQSYEDSRLAIKVHEQYRNDIGNPNGWSGAPIFFLWSDESQDNHLGFGGMITHGSSTGGFLVYRAEDIRTVVSGVIATPYRSAKEQEADTEISAPQSSVRKGA
ncbi:hypothetical protein G6L94_11915 [Agrobacterium rhizogenes]|jgi:hypothetical protein|nr:hypothetical protein [Rhizobium rhizogenes]NTI94395.1 hypothetical protein [Rhizobium rhizogenes]NTJ56862.1 hypothetical protein [Rhizobium rhizogenes]OCJ14911.1 hypothetical protein A6U89_22680 [Agrobacterium sp. B133/95]